MPGIGIGLSSAFGTKPLYYLLRDEFTDTVAAGSVHGTSATPGPGTRTVVDTGSELSISSGDMNIAALTGAYDPGIWYGAITRAAGRLMVTEVNMAVNNRFRIGFDTNQSDIIDEQFLRWLQGTNQVFAGVSGTDPVVFNPTPVKDSVAAIVLRSAGAFFFLKEEDSLTTWTLLWMSGTFNTATLYPAISVDGAGATVSTSDYIRVPDNLWLPTPLVSDGFTDDNATSLDAHATDGLGHAEGVAGGRGSGGDGYSWTEESGDWDIQSNRANPDGAAIASVDAGEADVLVDCTVNGGAADQPAIMLRWLDTSNYWYLQADRANNQFELHEYNATVDTVRASAAVTFNNSTDYDLRAIAYGQIIDGYADGANKISYGSAALNETKTEHGIRAENTAGQFEDFAIYARDGYSALNGF